jgi:hypothetical protein
MLVGGGTPDPGSASITPYEVGAHHDPRGVFVVYCVYCLGAPSWKPEGARARSHHRVALGEHDASTDGERYVTLARAIALGRGEVVVGTAMSLGLC